MEVEETESDKKEIERNSGHPIFQIEIPNGDPIKGDANGFTIGSLAFEAYEARLTQKYGAEDSLKAAEARLRSGDCPQNRLDLFTCPLCKLCFINPKKFLIHFKWHTFGVTDASQSNGDADMNMVCYCFCSQSFRSSQELEDHVREEHGPPKSLKISKSTTSTSDSNDRETSEPQNIDQIIWPFKHSIGTFLSGGNSATEAISIMIRDIHRLDTLKESYTAFGNEIGMRIRDLQLLKKDKTASLEKFALEMVEPIVNDHHKTKMALKKSQADLHSRLGVNSHFIGLRLSPSKPNDPGTSSKLIRRRCVVCASSKKRVDTKYICKQCNVSLCVTPCYEIYHTMVDF